MKRALILLGAIAGAASIYWLLPAAVDALARRAAAIFVFAAVFWASRVIPLFATSLVVVVASILLLAESGGLAPSGGIEAGRFLTEFGSNIIMLFLGGLTLSVALSKHGVDQTIAARLLRPIAHRPLVLVYAVMGITAFFSMWMSNTATTAMMLAIVASFLRGRPHPKRDGTGLALAVAMGANIGGIATPIGTPPNAIALGALRAAGYDVTFLRWMLMATPLALLLLAIAGVIIYRLHGAATLAPVERAEESPKMSRPGWLTLGVAGMSVAAWLSSGVHGVPDGVVAVGAAALLAAFGLVDAEDVKAIEWPTLIMIWGGLTLGRAMEWTGLVQHLGGLPVADLPGWVLAGLVVAIAVVLSSFISNTATAALLVPLVLAMSVPDQAVLVVLAALSCSFAMALPVSTPPNALVFGSGRIRLRELARIGGVLALISIVLMMLGYRVMVPLALPQ